MNNRLEFLDFLRFVAAFSVLLQHGCEALFPWFRELSINYFQFGVFGVTLFFLCSGFIIPASLEKHGSLRQFWISRVFRLFPLYYVSIFSTLVLIYFGMVDLNFPTAKVIFWNLTMLMRFVGQPSILGLYWTLSTEIIFYLLVSLLFLLKVLNRTVLIATISLTLCIVLGVVLNKFFHIFSKGWGTLFYIATMFTGSVFYKNYQKQVSNKTLLSLVLFAIVTCILNTYVNLFNNPSLPQFLGTLSFLPVTNAILAAFLLFSFCFNARKFQYPSILLKMGVISYSLYLVQGTIYLIIPRLFGESIFTLLFWLTLIVMLSFLTYRLIEKPFMNLGHLFKEKTQSVAKP